MQEAATVAFAVILTGAGQVTVKPVVLVRETDIAEPVAPELKLTGLPTLIVKSPT